MFNHWRLKYRIIEFLLCWIYAQGLVLKPVVYICGIGVIFDGTKEHLWNWCDFCCYWTQCRLFLIAKYYCATRKYMVVWWIVHCRLFVLIISILLDSIVSYEIFFVLYWSWCSQICTLIYILEKCSPFKNCLGIWDFKFNLILMNVNLI